MAPASGSSTAGQKTSIPYAAIPLLAILGAGAAVLIVFAFARLLTDDEEPWRSVSESQAGYMRLVRRRNREDIEALFARRARRAMRPDYGHGQG